MKPSTEKVLNMLRAAGSRGVTSGEFAQAYVLRYSARLLELRDSGRIISRTPVPEHSQYCYVLEFEPRA